jgi:AraC-like DNA-binding protein
VRDLTDTVTLLSVLQGAVLAAVLAVRRNNRLANRILAALVGAVAWMLLLGYAEHRWAWSGHPHLLALNGPWPLLFGPLLYLYIVALTRPLERIEARWLVHALPFVAYIVYMGQVFYLKTGDEKVAMAQGVWAGRAPASFHIVSALEVVQAMAYLAMSWIALRRYGRKIAGYYSDLTRIDLRWLRSMVIAHMGVWSIVIVSGAVRAVGVRLDVLQTFSQAVQIGSAAVLFLTGYVSLWQPELGPKARQAEVADVEVAHVEAADVPIAEGVPIAEEGRSAAANKYQRNRLADDEAKELAQKLEALMRQRKMYRDAALTLQVLADSLGATPHLMSQVLNVHIGKSFYVFVNSYRAEALKAVLADRSQRERGVLELALEAGFNSKSTLNSFFKRHTGLTPTEYRRQALRDEGSSPPRKSADISGG